MPQFQITVKQKKQSADVRIEPGMSVMIVTQSSANPIHGSAGQQAINDAFMRVYGVDLKRLYALSPIFLDVRQL